MDNLTNKANILAAILRQIGPGKLKTVLDGPGTLIIVLHDGRRAAAWIDQSGTLRLDEIDQVC